MMSEACHCLVIVRPKSWVFNKTEAMIYMGFMGSVIKIILMKIVVNLLIFQEMQQDICDLLCNLIGCYLTKMMISEQVMSLLILKEFCRYSK